MREEDLIGNIKEFLKNAELAMLREEYNTSLTLYFKTLAVMADLYLLRTIGRIPNNHSERFRILERSTPGIYQILDKNFLAYQESYRSKLKKENCEAIKEDVTRILRILKL